MTRDNQLTQRIVPFYLGIQADVQGRMIQEIWSWNFEELECVHDFVQWLFPLPEKSAFNPNAPVVGDSVVEAFRSSAVLRQNLVRLRAEAIAWYRCLRQLYANHRDAIGAETFQYWTQAIET